MSLIDESKLLSAITKAQEEFVFQKESRLIFDHLLTILLDITGSEYGFIGEVKQTEENQPYLKTHAITNIAWNDDTQKFYEENAPKGLEFFNLKSLFGQVMVTEKPVIANSPATDPRRTGIPEGHPPLNAFLGIPFFFNKQLNGMVGVSNREGGYNEEIVKELQPFLVTCASLIEGFKNVNRKKDYEKRLEQSIRELKESNDELSRFAYITSHDLKSPLRGITMLLDHVQSDLEEVELPPEVKENMDKIQARISRMYKLIEDIINYSKIGSTKDVAEIDTRKTLEEIEETVVSGDKQVQVEYIGDFPNIEMSQSQFFQLGLNLISNAVKYNDKEVCKVRISSESQKQKWNLTIEDNGPGIPAKYREKVFELFQVLDNTSFKDSTGVGLTIVQKVINRNNGQLTLSESEWGGCKFDISFDFS